MLEFRILGPLEVLDDDRPVQLGGRKQRAALAILLLSANRVVSVERLADDLYEGSPPVTAVTQVQRQVSELRKLLGAAAIETRTPGYLLHVAPDGLDLDRFERASGDAEQALERGDAEAAASLLRQALDLWRGAPLADLAYESFARTAIARLDELRLAALERRIDAELELGRHAAALGELEALVWEHPLREGLRARLMLALYRAGRQADALEVYRATRELLVEELGIEPSPSLRDLERRLLAHDPSLDAARRGSAPAPAEERTLLVAPSSDESVAPLLALAEPLARLPERTLIVAQLVHDQDDVAAASAALAARSGGNIRAAAFASPEPARDVVRLARNYDVELILLDGHDDLVEGRVGDALRAVVEHSPADVALVVGGAVTRPWADGVFVPFGGGESDWAALELAAWLAAATQAPLRLVGTRADARRGLRDASRLLADASLATQRIVGVGAEPVLADPSGESLVEAVRAAAVVVAGFPTRWRAEGLDASRTALLRGCESPILLVHRGARPSGLAPRESRTRFSWSLGATS